MDSREAQETWDEYYERIRQRRTSEIALMQTQMRGAGVTDDTGLLVDFGHFSSEKSDAEALLGQLGENYEMTLRRDDKSGYWIAEGTTRPDACQLTEQELLDWVVFMCDVAHSHGCVFSSFKLEVLQGGQSWSNQGVHTDEA